MRRQLIAGNWKMNGFRAEGTALAREIVDHVGLGKPAEVLICPPATLLLPIADIVADRPVLLGAQDCHRAKGGAFTGDISAPMLKDAGCSHVIVGHSERRALHGETNADVRAKATAALANGLSVILCVGETEAERDAGHARAIVATQLEASVPPAATPATLTIAYEPIWAIGTGWTPSCDDIDAIHRHIREVMGSLMAGGTDGRILYGGSVKALNAAELLAIPDVDGALVGGASLSYQDFAAIIDAARG